MKHILQLLFCCYLLYLAPTPANSQTQDAQLKQLKALLQNLQQKQGYQKDTAYINTINEISFLYADRFPDSALLMLNGLPEQSRAIKFGKGEINSYKILGNAWQTKGDFNKALEFYTLALNIAEKNDESRVVPGILGNIGLVYLNQGNYAMALQKFYASLAAAEAVNDQLVIRSSFNNIGTIHFYQGKMEEAEKAYQKTLQISRDISDTTGIITAYNNLGEVNLEQKDPVKAMQNLSLALEMASKKNLPYMLVAINNSLGDTYLRLDSLEKSAAYFKTALLLARNMGNARATCKALIGIAKVESKQGLLPAALISAQEALQKASEMGQAQLLRDANEVVAAIYEKMGMGNEAIKFYKQYKVYADSLVSIESERAAANYKAEYEFAKKEAAFQRKTLQQGWLMFSALAGVLSLLIIIWIISRSRKRLSLTYKDLQNKNEIIEGQKIKAEETLFQLKAAQSQLIQSEKMASLGELTAGIAHEIQNPLNFVNNFSEVSTELVEEMNNEINKGNIEEAKVIASDLKQNMAKINHHGKRAGDIVKGMLQHSRSSSGTKEPTDINALADEYLRLAYHGLRAKDKLFNATMKTDFDESLSADEAGIGHINIIPQDIGRVILNLITNAFYVVDEKKKSGVENYEPTVSVSTKKIQGKVEVKVTDNGNGIPQKVLDKIFQPFFTTKPTGQGTGLGLSLSYDIVKAHGGELKVETKEGMGTEFIIQLPIV
jgi:signal transduction histidine kinase/Tfp pilus assembly protein PilF